MACRDLLFPSNEKKRNQTIRLHQDIVSCVERNFDTTNKVSEICNKYLHTNFYPIKVKEADTLEESCKVLKMQIHRIQQHLSKIDNELKNALEPDLYELFRDVSVSVSEKQEVISKRMKKRRQIVTVSYVVVASILWPVLSVVLHQTIESICKIMACCIGVLPVIFLGVIALIINYFIGKKESEALDEAIKEYQKVLSDLKPATERYQFAVMKACIKLDIPWEK
ncbi:single-pass membrane and coiled-coil domain-containing protein 3-like [Protopterus annectens]|uniref:single-pass membrane and coiled-coil domain-containing protein 3-like n=1 Tax=Protopterus annectens TaxID=7888 RepID=UPI001CFB49B7|nr:single-pass membrane and coiled-coil domain-containing protein 3-like [Protopterus annectens]